MEISSKSPQRSIKRILIANRGEIVSRIQRTCDNLGIETVVIYSDDDDLRPYVKAATLAVNLEGSTLNQTYLNQELILKTAIETKADAIHPGYGFLSENADFAQKCIDLDVIWIGPSPSIMRRMADKTQARKLAENINIPVVPAFTGKRENIKNEMTATDYPILLKAAAGGGGRGMRVVNTADELDEQIKLAAAEAKLAFGDDRLFIEKYLEKAKHIEVQILGDHHGNQVHLFERECTIQRRYQKIIEESPAASISAGLRKKLTQSALDLARASGYNSAGTVEFLVSPDEEYFFIETNARIQVEHPVTEMVTGIDLIEQQIRIAEGHPLGFGQEDIHLNGHALECRICAEDPENNFAPAPGVVSYYHLPKGENIRTDTALFQGAEISTNYDSLIAKLIVHKNTREEAIRTSRNLLRNSAVFGIQSNIPYLISILSHQNFRSSEFFTSFISLFHADLVSRIKTERENGLYHPALATYAFIRHKNLSVSLNGKTGNPWQDLGYWRAHPEIKVELDATQVAFEIRNANAETVEIFSQQNRYKCQLLKWDEHNLKMDLDGSAYHIWYQMTDQGVNLSINGTGFEIIDPLKKRNGYNLQATKNGLTERTVSAPLPGRLSQVNFREGDSVIQGKTLAIIESMKVENQILSPCDGVITEIYLEEGKQVKMKEAILRIKII